jgi:hypothetical protein
MFNLFRHFKNDPINTTLVAAGILFFPVAGMLICWRSNDSLRSIQQSHQRINLYRPFTQEDEKIYQTVYENPPAQYILEQQPLSDDVLIITFAVAILTLAVGTELVLHELARIRRGINIIRRAPGG